MNSQTEEKIDSDGAIAENFKTRFGRKPNGVVLAPGRVNIIGEHVDYMGYPVMACTIPYYTSVTFSADQEELSIPSSNYFLRIQHIDPEAYPEVIFANMNDVTLTRRDVPKWAKYIIASFFGLVEYFMTNRNIDRVGKTIDPNVGITQETSNPFNKLKNISFLVTGNLPKCAGLASSSSLTVTSALAFCYSLYQYHEPTFVRIDSFELAQLCANAEMHVGTSGGGGDHTAILLCQRGAVQLTTCIPLATETMMLPNEAAFVVANTWADAPKVNTASTRFNKRTFECRLGILMLAKKLHQTQLLNFDDERTLMYAKLARMANMSDEELLTVATEVIAEKSYTKESIMAALGPDLLTRLTKSRAYSAVWAENENFSVFQRARHVLFEAVRVERFKNICAEAENASKNGCSYSAMKSLGAVMDEGHNSLKEDYECSCVELDEMTQWARDNGAYGSRLTGAGWGGCCVSLVGRGDVERFCREMKLKYPGELRVIAVNPAGGPLISLYA